MQPIPEFKDSQVLRLIAGLATKWGGAAKCRELEAALRSVTDHPDYLRRVAALGPDAARNLVAAAVLGLAIACHIDELTGKPGHQPERN